VGYGLQIPTYQVGGQAALWDIRGLWVIRDMDQVVGTGKLVAGLQTYIRHIHAAKRYRGAHESCGL
jgi:hypothetical protein